MKGEGWHGFYYFSLFLLFFILCVKLLLSFFTLAEGRGCGFIFLFLIIILYILNKTLILFLLFEGRKGAGAFKNLLSEEGIRLISWFWKKQIVERWKWKMGWV